MKAVRMWCGILLLTTGLLAQTTTSSKPTKKKAAAATITAADVQAEFVKSHAGVVTGCKLISHMRFLKLSTVGKKIDGEVGSHQM